MKIHLVAVPPGGGEAEYSLTMESPAVPQVGDYLTVMREYDRGPPGEDYIGTEDFVIRRVRWHFTYPDDGKHHHTVGQEPVGKVGSIIVECEMALGAYSSRAHKRNVGNIGPEHEASAY